MNLRKLEMFYDTKDFNLLYNQYLSEIEDLLSIQSEKRIGILATSRKIKNIDRIILGLCQSIRESKNYPVIIPSMGSHGGGCFEGQRKILHSFGINEENTGANFLLSEDYINIGNIFGNYPVVINKAIEEVDYIIPVNRVKPNPGFNGKYESGLLKSLVVGLGYLQGARNFHKAVEDFGFESALIESSKLLINNLPILGYIGIIEDPLGEVDSLKVIDPTSIYEEEPKLLKHAYDLVPRLPLTDIADLLIIDEIGKNFGGAGFDPCVIGGEKGIQKIAKLFFVRNLSMESFGNAIGMGLMDFTTRRFFDKIDLEVTYTNGLSCNILRSVKIPLFYDNDKKVLEAVEQSLRQGLGCGTRLIWIKNTSNLSSILVSNDTLKILDLNKSFFKLTEEEFQLDYNKELNLMEHI